MKKLFLAVLLFIHSAVAKSPFNGAYLFGDLSAIIGSLKVSRFVVNEWTPDHPKTATKDSLSPIIPCLSIGFGAMRLCNRCLIIAFDMMVKFKTKSKYNMSKTKTDIKDNAAIIGAGIRLGMLLNGKSFMYVNALMTNIKIHATSTNESFAPLSPPFKKSGIAPEIRLGTVLGLTTNSYCDAHVSFSKKTYKQGGSGTGADLLEIKRQLITIGISYVYRFKRF